MLKRLLLLLAAGLVLAPSASAALYKVSLSGTQTSEWSFTETGTCTNDAFEEASFNGQGSGTSTTSFSSRPEKLVVSQVVGKKKRWAFAYQPYKVKYDVRRAGTHSQTCAGDETVTAPTADCGEKTGTGAARAILNLPANKKPGFMDFTATGGPAFGDCPYFYGLVPSQVSDDLGLDWDWPAHTLLGARKSVGNHKAFKRGKPVTITVKRTKPYKTEEDTGDTIRKTTGETSLQFKLRMTPVRR